MVADLFKEPGPNIKAGADNKYLSQNDPVLQESRSNGDDTTAARKMGCREAPSCCADSSSLRQSRTIAVNEGQQN